MRTSQLLKYACTALILTNAITFRFLVGLNIDFREAKQLATENISNFARQDADHDFSNGIVRIFRSDNTPSGPSRFTGQKDGPFEIWTKPVFYRDSKRLDLAINAAYVETYNTRMASLLEISQGNHQHL